MTEEQVCQGPRTQTSILLYKYKYLYSHGPEGKKRIKKEQIWSVIQILRECDQSARSDLHQIWPYMTLRCITHQPRCLKAWRWMIDVLSDSPHQQSQLVFPPKQRLPAPAADTLLLYLQSSKPVPPGVMAMTCTGAPRCQLSARLKLCCRISRHNSSQWWNLDLCFHYSEGTQCLPLLFDPEQIHYKIFKKDHTAESWQIYQILLVDIGLSGIYLYQHLCFLIWKQ